VGSRTPLKRDPHHPPPASTLAGLAADMFGVGGGIMKAAILLIAGLPPEAAATTAQAMILLTSATAASSVYAAAGAAPRGWTAAAAGVGPRPGGFRGGRGGPGPGGFRGGRGGPLARAIRQRWAEEPGHHLSMAAMLGVSLVWRRAAQAVEAAVSVCRRSLERLAPSPPAALSFSLLRRPVPTMHRACPPASTSGRALASSVVKPGRARRALHPVAATEKEAAAGDCSRRALLVGSTLSVASAAAAAARAAPPPPPAPAVDAASALLPYAEALTKKVVEFTLPNGLTFVVLERRGATGAPVVSVCTHADVGAFDEADGQTGMAHLLEHMAFKGTGAVGRAPGVSAATEAALMDAEDAAFYALRDLRGAGAGKAAIAAANARLAAAVEAAGAAALPNAWGSAIQAAGGRGLNAATSHDSTRYFVSLPSNALELWFALEAARFRAPVFRGLYAEKRVVAEERRARVEAAPLGLFQQRFARAALGNEYGRPVIGYPADVEAVGRAELGAFFRDHYGPRNLAIAVVGDASPARVRALAERYFGGWEDQSSGPGGPTTPTTSPPSTTLLTARPPDPVPRVTAADRAGPLVLQAYYRPGDGDPAFTASIEAACAILHGTRSARLYTSLIMPGVALAAQAVPAFPGDKHPCATLLAATPGAGVDPDICSDALAREVLRLAADGPTPAEMDRVHRAGLVSLYSSVRSNAGLAGALAGAAAAKGTWRALLDEVAAADGLGRGDVEDAAGRVFATDGNCTTGVVEAAAARVTIAPAGTF